ncbi:MAG: 2-C-methyl-D-erythritol 2,4-cyclodiphosphate synthase [Bacteroidales bacterium]
MDFRIGHGYDVHRLEEGLPFVLGGVALEHHKGARGHSDADVLLHAIADALLGSLALGDIGQHFPDTDPAHRGLDSRILLAHCMDLVRKKGYELSNLDCTVCLQTPKIKDRIPAMRVAIAQTLGVPEDRVSVKATTEEKLGFTGREEGVSAHATVLVQSPAVGAGRPG